jgi:RNA polymerase sigma-70 factor (ECF subfamily)
MAGAGTVAVVEPPAPQGPLRRLEPEDLGDHLDRLYRAAWGLCGRREDAEDLVQETYARVLARPRWLRRDDDLAYLLRTLRNVHVSRMRAAGRRPAPVPMEGLHAEPSAPHGAWSPDAALDARELFAAIAALPGPSRDVLVAVDVAGLSYAEAGRALGVREATITTRLHRARRRIAVALGDAPPPDGPAEPQRPPRPRTA